MRFVKQLYKGGQAFLESLVKKMKPRDLYKVTVKTEDVQLSRRIDVERIMWTKTFTPIFKKAFKSRC